MVTGREIPLLRVLMAFLIATFLFSAGFLIGYSVSYIKYQDVFQKQEEIKYDLLSIELEGEFLNSCEEFVLYILSKKLDEMGSILGVLEKRFGKNDAKVIEQKKKYAVLEVQHFLNIKKYKEKCNKNMSIVLFFYSNREPYESSSERTGYILSNLKSKNPKETMVYSFDYDLNISIIQILKKVYNVTSQNTIVLNENIKLTNINKIEEIEKYLL